MKPFTAVLRLAGTTTANVTAVYIYAAGGRETSLEIIGYSLAMCALIIFGYVIAPAPRDFTRETETRETETGERRDRHDVEADELETTLTQEGR